MLETNQNQFFEQLLFQTLGEQVRLNSFSFKSGGCINNAVQLNTSKGNYLVKYNSTYDGSMFDLEAKGLRLLKEAREIRVPGVYGYGQTDQKNYILMEYIDSQRPDPNYWEMLGHGLARLHQHSKSQHGLEEDNFIGRLPQKNSFYDNWVNFFIENRLNVQLGLALYNGKVDQQFVDDFKSIYKRLPDILPDENPALLHGDLWSGNVMIDDKGEPCLIDPAVYYGNREIEISFTFLFGGFDDRFYRAYDNLLPLREGFMERVEIYNLYPLLVHLNLFGNSYLEAIRRIIKKLQ